MKSICNFFTILLFTLVFPYFFKTEKINWGSDDGQTSSLGHGELLELRLLEKSARHNFIIARHHSSK